MIFSVIDFQLAFIRRLVSRTEAGGSLLNRSACLTA